MSVVLFDDRYFMQQAMAEATKAFDAGEVPVGAVVTFRDRIIARAHNQVEALQDVTAHAEILAITAAENALGSKYLQNCKMFLTLEPCLMCAGALYWSQLSTLIYAAPDEKRGFMRVGRTVLHPSTTVQYGLMKEESEALLHSFFQHLREGQR